ncbi:MAG TPA: hypothetical protein VFW16_01400 [Streptosporangiaceae bacterium]|nr:hypothetical protein [Streptosporangiaceae bacterium]
MIDLHLINTALAGLGIGTAAVVLIAAAILVIASFARRGNAGQPIVPARAGATARAAVSNESEVKEPALR